MKEFHILLRTLCLTALLCLTATHALAYMTCPTADGCAISASGYENERIFVVEKDVNARLCAVTKGSVLVILPGVTLTVSDRFYNEGTIYALGLLRFDEGIEGAENWGTIYTNTPTFIQSIRNEGIINNYNIFNYFQKVPARAPTSTQSGWKEYWEIKFVCGEDSYLMGNYKEQ